MYDIGHNRSLARQATESNFSVNKKLNDYYPLEYVFNL